MDETFKSSTPPLKMSKTVKTLDFSDFWGPFEAPFQHETVIDVQKVYSVLRLIAVESTPF